MTLTKISKMVPEDSC